MIYTASEAKQLDHWVHPTADFRSDLAWWCCFIKSWNGWAMMQVLANAQPPIATITTDVSGTWGCGAFWVEAGQWIQSPWPNEWQHTPIHAKQLLPIILAIATWDLPGIPLQSKYFVTTLQSLTSLLVTRAETNLLCTCFVASILYQRIIAYK